MVWPGPHPTWAPWLRLPDPVIFEAVLYLPRATERPARERGDKCSELLTVES